ncbi:MAG: porphobilinogen synthase, partial [Candidatus Omnitrophica bacterium CG_4_10_14_0_2_um_filter_44_9]
YLDIVRQARQKFRFPLAAYNVSGEYSMVKYGAKAGLWDEKKMVFEVLTSIKRAGADWIITYHAKDIAQWLRG